jgi:hypothetical protein
VRRKSRQGSGSIRDHRPLPEETRDRRSSPVSRTKVHSWRRSVTKARRCRRRANSPPSRSKR